MNTRLEDKRFKKLKTKEQLQSLSDDSTDVFVNNVVDYYRNRPIDLKDRSLFYFASWFEVCKPPPNTSNNRRLLRIYIPLLDQWLRKIQKPYVLRFPCFAALSEDNFYCMLILLYPQHSEAELLDHPTYKESYLAKHSLFDMEIDWTHFSLADQIQTIIRKHHLSQQEIPIHSQNTTSEQIQTELSDDMDTGFCFNTSSSGNLLDDNQNPSTYSDLTSVDDSIHCMQLSILPDATYDENVLQLTDCQKQALLYTLCKNILQKNSQSHCICS